MSYELREGQGSLTAYVAEQSVSGVGMVVLTARKGPKMVTSLP